MVDFTHLSRLCHLPQNRKCKRRKIAIVMLQSERWFLSQKTGRSERLCRFLKLFEPIRFVTCSRLLDLLIFLSLSVSSLTTPHRLQSVSQHPKFEHKIKTKTTKDWQISFQMFTKLRRESVTLQPAKRKLVVNRKNNVGHQGRNKKSAAALAQ
jgi:hypothetical protein